MRLSDAILLGSTLRPQAFGTEFSGDDGSCTWGAAIEAAGCPVIPPDGDQSFTLPGRCPPDRASVKVALPREWVPVLLPTYSCPHCAEAMVGSLMIPHLNDAHRWTRQRVAALVRTWEDATPRIEPDALLSYFPRPIGPVPDSIHGNPSLRDKQAEAVLPVPADASDSQAAMDQTREEVTC